MSGPPRNGRRARLLIAVVVLGVVAAAGGGVLIRGGTGTPSTDDTIDGRVPTSLTVSQSSIRGDCRLYVYWQFSDGVQPADKSAYYELRATRVDRTTKRPVEGARRSILRLGQIATKEARDEPVTPQREFRGSIAVPQLNYGRSASYELRVRWVSEDGSQVSVWSPAHHTTIAQPQQPPCAQGFGRRYW